MFRKFPLAVMAACFLLTVTEPDSAQAAVMSDNGQLEHVLVSVPIHRKEAETALPVTVLSGEELWKKSANTLGETLSSSPGLANASFGPAVGQPVIRGQQGARVTVLQNSTTTADASNISADHAVSAEPILAESIEILRGPSTLLYGGGAIGGVVNVVDNRVPVSLPDNIEWAAELRHGSVNNETTAVIKLEGSLDKFAFHIDGLNRSSDDVSVPVANGRLSNTSADTESLTVGTSYIFDAGYLGMAVNYLDSEYGVPEGAHVHGDDHGDEEEANIRIDVEQLRYDIRGDWHDVSRYLEKLRWFSSYTDYEHRELEGLEVGTVYKNRTWENRLEAVHAEMGSWHGATGLQFRNSHFSALGEESFIPKAKITSYGLFLLEDYHADTTTYEFGLRFDRSTVDASSATIAKKDVNTMSVSGSALWELNEAWSLGLALSSSERAPTVEELYSNSEAPADQFVVHAASQAIEVGNPDLDPERANNIDVSLSYRGESASGYITLFYNDFEDFIFLQNTSREQGQIPIFNYAQVDAKFKGLEFEGSLPLSPIFSGELALTLFGDLIRGELESGGDVPRMPASRLGVKLDYSTSRFSSFVSVVVADSQSRPGDNELRTKAYTRLELGADYGFDLSSNVEGLFFIKIKNLGDDEIRSSTSFLRDVAPEPGRSIEGGVRLLF